MYPNALAYIGISANGLEDWASFAPRLLGLQKVDKGPKSLAFRMDDRKQRFCISDDGGKGFAYMGWEVADKAALEACASRLETAGVAVTRGTRALCAQRHVADLIAFADPLGNRVELCLSPEVTSEPFVATRNISGFRTGTLGMGHVVMYVESTEQVVPFYRDLLGFGISDFYNAPIKAYFMHINQRHHSIAFVEQGRTAVHHMMMELYSLDDVGQAYDIAQSEEGRVAITFGRHCGDYMTSFYSWTPSEFMVEYGWGGRLIDPKTWVPAERREGPSLWGHDMLYLDPPLLAMTRQLRRDIAEAGVRQPVQVIAGNYNLMPGACPWWDAKLRRAAE